MKCFAAFSLLCFSVSMSSVFAADLVYHDDFDAAFNESKATGKPLVAIFSGKWCGYCTTMKNTVYPSSKVKPFHDSFVWAYLDVDKAATRKVMPRFQVRGVPHVAFVSAHGEILSQNSGLVSQSQFAERISNALEKNGPVRPAVGETADSAPALAPVVSQSQEQKKGGIFKVFKKKN